MSEETGVVPDHVETGEGSSPLPPESKGASPIERTAFDAGDNDAFANFDPGDAGQSTLPATEPRQTVELPVVASEPETEEDIWAQATDVQRAAYEAAQHQARSNSGRINAYQKQILDLTERLQQAHQIPTVGRDWEEGELFPRIPPHSGERKSTPETMDHPTAIQSGERMTGAKPVPDHQVLGRTLRELHPDFPQVVDEPDFLIWLANQPKYVQETAARNGNGIADVREAAGLLHAYKETKRLTASQEKEARRAEEARRAKVKSRRERQLTSGAAVASRGGGVGSGPPDDFRGSFEYYAKKQRDRRKKHG